MADARKRTIKLLAEGVLWAHAEIRTKPEVIHWRGDFYAFDHEDANGERVYRQVRGLELGERNVVVPA